MSKRGKKLKTEIGTFLRQYARKAQRGVEPNDRKYDEDIERIIKKMKPEELSTLMSEDIDGNELNSDESKDLIRTAQQYADEILRGEITPYEGGRKIWTECQIELELGDHRLDPFVYWSSEYEETSNQERQLLCEKSLREAATMLLEKGSAL
jgi:hypothetical protein